MLINPQLTDVCVKNGGNHFLAEVSSREFMDNLVSILKVQVRTSVFDDISPKFQSQGLNYDVRNRTLKLIQNWAMAFEGKPEFSYVNTVYKMLISDGMHFC